MFIPRGNALFEKQSLPYTDVNTLYGNLEQQAFTGFIKLDNDGVEDFMFFSHGQFLRAIEQEDTQLRVLMRGRVLNKIKSEVATSVYILASPMVNVLSLAFAFQPVYRNTEVRKKEFKKIRDQLEADEQTGIIEVSTRDGAHYLLVDRGKLVFNNFASAYGQIMCGIDDISRFLDYVGKHGAQLSVYAEKAAEIEERRREVEERLERVKVLLCKSVSGLFVKDDMVAIDEYIVREWGIKPTGTFALEMELADGTLVNVKCQATKKLGGYVSVPAKLMKKIGLRDGDALSVQPLI